VKQYVLLDGREKIIAVIELEDDERIEDYRFESIDRNQKVQNSDTHGVGVN
jgi:hypothetical protein